MTSLKPNQKPNQEAKQETEQGPNQSSDQGSSRGSTLQTFVITIDGPAASGKTSVSRELARRLGCKWVSTGAFYRGLAYCAYRLGLDTSDEEALAKLAISDRWKVLLSDDQTQVFLDDQDVTQEIHKEEYGGIASQVSHFPLLRAALLGPQRKCAEHGQGLVAEGRDCGTVVFPDANAKIYLTADRHNRAARRAKELGLSEQATVRAQEQRDLQDSTRKVAPLQIPIEALVLDSTELDFQKVVERVEVFAKNKLAQV